MAGNANSGKAKFKPMREALIMALNRDETDLVKGRTKMQSIAESLVDRATGGDVAAIKEVFDRVDGKVPQGVTGGDDGDNPISIAISRIELVAPSLVNDNAQD